MKKKLRIKKQTVFNLISIICIFIFGTFFGYKFFYHMLENNKPNVYSDILSERIIEAIDPYGRDKTINLTNGIYRFVGNANTNYVKYMGYMWRVIRINEDGSITMIMEDSVISLTHGERTSFKDSQVYYWLNSNNEVANTGIFQNTLDISYLSNTITCIDRFDKIDEISCFERDMDTLISLLSVKDYKEAGGKNSYLDSGEAFWTSNTTRDNRYWYISENGDVGIGEHTNRYNIRPVVTLKTGTKVVRGHGVADDPYIIYEHIPTTTDSIWVGEYIEFNDTLWRVTAVNAESVKIISMECLLNEEDECIAKKYGSANNTFDIKRSGNLLTYLNTEYYNSIENKDYIIEGIFNTGNYDRDAHDYLPTFKKTNKAFIGLPSVADPFAYDLPNIFLLNTQEDNEFSIFVVNNDRSLYEDIIFTERNIRPVIHIRTDIQIKEGNGTYLEPYILGGITSGN